jgi:hypothetical protein
MTGMMPFFLTGANAKIRIDDTTMAFCTNLSYSVKVLHRNPKILGMYEGHSIEPMGYEVTGSFTIIKYTEGMARMHDGLHGKKTPSGVNGRGNSIGAWRRKGRWNESITGAGDSGQSHQGLNPFYFNNSVMFDIEVYQKDPHGNDLPVSRLKNCRITQMDFQLSKNGVATQAYQFMAVYADDDTFVTSSSGVGQNLGA